MFNIINLKEIRKDTFISQKDIAKKIGISYDAYAKYEQRKTLPSLETIFKLSKYYNLNIDYILRIQEKREKTRYDKYNRKLIANNLKALRLSKSLSQRRLSLKLDIKQSAIQRYESSLSNPSLRTLFKYYKFFNFSFNDLVTKDFNSIYGIKK